MWQYYYVALLLLTIKSLSIERDLLDSTQYAYVCTVEIRLAERAAIGSISSLDAERCHPSLWPIDPEVSSDSDESLG